MASSSPARRWSRLRFALVALTALYGLVVLAAYGTLALAADRAWFGTVLLFGPRWVLLVPAAVLGAASLALSRPRLLAPLALAAVAVVGPIMGFEVPSPTSTEAPDGAARARVVTFNVGQKRLDDPDVTDVVRRTRADVVAMQEVDPRSLSAGPNGLGIEDGQGGKAGPRSPVEGYSIHCDLQNCILSRYPIVRARARNRDDVWERGGSGAIALYDLDAGELGVVHLLHVHLETAREGLEALLHERTRGISAMRANIVARRWESDLAREFLAQAEVDVSRVIVVGDFNMPVESAIYRDKWSDFENAFSAVGLGFGFTKHTRLLGARIDHVLLGGGVHAVDAWVDERTTSDHRPVVADLWIAPAAPGNREAISDASRR